MRKVRFREGLGCELVPDILDIVANQVDYAAAWPTRSQMRASRIIKRGEWCRAVSTLDLAAINLSTAFAVEGIGWACLFLISLPRRSRRPGLRTAADGRARKRAEPRPGLLRCGVGLRPRAIPPEFKTELVMSALNSLLIHDHHIGTVREATADEIITAARACVAKRMRRGASLTSPKAARDYLVLRFAELQHEVFCVIYLDSRHRVIECQDLFRGTIDGASVHPREVVK